MGENSPNLVTLTWVHRRRVRWSTLALVLLHKRLQGRMDILKRAIFNPQG
jgi:hypothetical protein